MSKIELVSNSLRAMILSGELAPGSPIDKAMLAEKLDASRQPIASAIERLAFEGLVEVRPQHGSFVSKLDGAVLKDWLLVRSAIEVEFAVRFAKLCPKAEITELAVNLFQQASTARTDDVEGFYRLDVGFHQIITGFTPSPEGHAVLARAQTNLRRVRRLLLPEPGRLQHTLAEHKAIFDGVKSGNVHAAADAMRAHIESVATHLQHFIANNPGLVGHS